MLKALHFFWDFVPPQKESRHLIFPFCISPHFPYIQPTDWCSFPSQRLSPSPPCVLPDMPSSAASWLSPLPFCAKSARFLCRCQQGQHTHEALLDLYFINQKAAFCSLYSHPSFKKISLVLLPPSLFYFPRYFCLTKSLVIFFMFLCLAFKTSFFLPVLHLLPLNSFATRLSSMLLVPTTSTLQLNHLLDSIFTYFPYLFLGVLALSVPNHTDVKSIPCPLLLSNGTIFYWELTAHIGCNNQTFSQGHVMTCKC